MRFAAGLLLLTGCSQLPEGPARYDAAVAGMTLADWNADGYLRAAEAGVAGDLADLGANTVVLVITAYQADERSALPEIDPTRTPSSGAIEAFAGAARAAGLSLVLKPHVDLEAGGWRGYIEPDDPDAWFEAYRSFVLPLAEQATALGATGLCVGTELAGTVRYESRWRALIGEVRGAFDGELTYAASWDEAERVPFWDSVDRCGVNAWYPVARRPGAGRLELLEGWQPWLGRLEGFAARASCRLILSEVGYRSVRGAGLEPWDFERDDAVDLQAQADLTWAALSAASMLPNNDGVWWWHWPADETGGPTDKGYSPLGKPAADELRDAWR